MKTAIKRQLIYKIDSEQKTSRIYGTRNSLPFSKRPTDLSVTHINAVLPQHLINLKFKLIYSYLLHYRISSLLLWVFKVEILYGVELFYVCYMSFT